MMGGFKRGLYGVIGTGKSQYFHSANMEAMPQALLHDREAYKQELLAK